MDAALQTAGVWLICASLVGALLLNRCRPRNRRHGSRLPATFWRHLRQFSRTSAIGRTGLLTGERDEG
jgi:hypothetical protein